MSFDAIDPAADIRLVAVDMDGTLLDADGQVPEATWPLIERLRERGIVFTPASGRQFARLREQFAALGPDAVIVAENGTFVARGEQEVYSDVIAPRLVDQVVGLVREHAALLDAGLVLCAKRRAYVECSDEAFADAVAPYYAAVEHIGDFAALDEDVIKIAIHVEGGSERLARLLAPIAEHAQVVVSGRNWVDVMNLGVDKGVAIAALQRSMGITAQQTVVFGDYLNDLQMLDAAEHSFAMSNAHPDVLARARFRAPANTEFGVVRVLEDYLQASRSLI